ncbi:MAG: hypothetical protein ACYC7L_17290 [Nitrospirota bacterium]
MRKNLRNEILLRSLLLIMLVLCASGCYQLVGPSDEEVIKAVKDMELFSGGVEKFTLKSPIVIVEKGVFSSNGAWIIKAKLTYTYMMAGGHETKPIQKVQTFIISKSKDGTGNTIWKAASGTP